LIYLLHWFYVDFLLSNRRNTHQFTMNPMPTSIFASHEDIYLSALAGQSVKTNPAELAAQVANAFFAESLFDVIPDVVFYVKDTAGRYVSANDALVERCGYQSKSNFIGRRDNEVFPVPFAASYRERDQVILHSGKDLRQQLEFCLYPSGLSTWCITHKVLLLDKAQKVIGLTGISRDLAMPDQRHPAYHSIASAVRHLHSYFFQDLQMDILTQLTSLSSADIESNFLKIFSLTPRQMLVKLRLDSAINSLLVPTKSVTDIAKEVGYQDVNVFANVFKATVGLTPSEYRQAVSGQVVKPNRRH
jgi:AraC-like DNA-binding protein/PAS domain-containing protein